MEASKKKRDRDTLALQIYEAVAAQPARLQQLGNILTKSEKMMIGRRLLVAQAIMNGKTRRQLQTDLGISPNTFAQVNRWLASEFKEYNGFTVTNKIQSNHARNTARPHIQPFSYEHLKRNYPAHFLLFSLAEAVWQKAKKQSPH